jgi:hypothetical protein
MPGLRAASACANMCSMTVEADVRARFRSAVRARDAAGALREARAADRLPLEDAVALTLLVRDLEPGRYARMSARLHGRAVDEVGAELDGAGLLAAALAALRDDSSLPAGVVALRGWLETYELWPAVAELEAWQQARRAAA